MVFFFFFFYCLELIFASFPQKTRAMGTLEAQLETAKKELKDYKQRAVQALQSKTSEVEHLSQRGGGSSVSIPALEASLAETKAALAQAKLAAEQAEETAADAAMSLELARDELATERREHADEVSGLKAQIVGLRADATRAGEDARRALLEKEVAVQDAERTRAVLAEFRAGHDAEVAALHRRLQATSTHEELESRLNAITDHLEAKQGLIATLTSEKAAMAHEIRRLREQLDQMTQASMAGHGAGSSGGRGNQGLLGARDDFVSVDIETASVPVKRATTAMDAISITVASNLRRSPAFRYSLFAYFVFLHLWAYYFVGFVEREHHPKNFTREMPKPIIQ